ncbi:MAG: signal transduction histidine kinase [Bermanella sp.]|jgi:signal transduction histidine kinase
MPEKSLVGFHVKDNGAGIAEGDQQRIFGLIARGSEGGGGIGLAICKKIIEQCGGRIDVDSRPGEGANFKVYLPVGA